MFRQDFSNVQSDIKTEADHLFLVPVKSLKTAKSRLAEELDDQSRRNLVLEMATEVLKCLPKEQVALVCNDVELRDWSRDQGYPAILVDANNLNSTLYGASYFLENLGYLSLTVVHADLPIITQDAQSPDWLVCELDPGNPLSREKISRADFLNDYVCLVPDRFEDGTTVLQFPLNRGFKFHYGPRSFSKHLAEAKSLKLETFVVRGTPWSSDLDLPKDLDEFEMRKHS
ncbi:MAG: hypothetical protein HKL80_06285 [Acidimicrobiales bacterium]|nr:hypothetical protein [Acidimicrobiales bacterium]